MRYLVLTAESATELMQEVNNALAHGWNLLGGVTAFNEHHARHVTIEYTSRWSTVHFAQALVKS